MAKSPHDKALQRALLQWKRPEMRRLVVEALHKAGREDLIGYGKDCLIRHLHSGGPSSGEAQKVRRGAPDKKGRPPQRAGKPGGRHESRDKRSPRSGGRGRRKPG